MSKTPPLKKPDDKPESVAEKPRHKRKPKPAAEQAPMAHDESNWLVSYADMMTLLFGFFVLMYSFSRVDEKKFEIVRKDVARYFGGQIKINPTVKKLEEEIKDIISAAGIDKNIQIVARDSEIELQFKGNLHFLPGTAKLTDESSFVLSKLIDSIKRNIKANAISVEGHTDDSPIQTAVFPSNWELSGARASTVVREFEKYGFDSAKLSAEGLGSSRPIVPNRDSKGTALVENQEINRRVIVKVAFNREMDDAIRALKTGEFISADTPPIDTIKTPLIHQGEGEPTWNEKMAHDLSVTQDKLRLAEERLKETESRARAAKNLAEMQAKLKKIEEKISQSEAQTTKHLDAVKRLPASKK